MPLKRTPTPSHLACMWSSCPTEGPPQVYGNSSANWEIAPAHPTGRRQVAWPMRLGAISLVDDLAELRPLGPRVLDSTQSLLSSPRSHLGIPSDHPQLRQVCCPLKLDSFMGKLHTSRLSSQLTRRIKVWWGSGVGETRLLLHCYSGASRWLNLRKIDAWW